MSGRTSSGGLTSGFAVEKELLSGRTRPVYVVAGEEEFWAFRFAELLEPHFPGGKESLDPESTDFSEIAFMVSQPSFFGGKLLVVNGADELLAREEVRFSSIADGNCLFLSAKVRAQAVPERWVEMTSALGGVVVDAGLPDATTAVQWVESEVSRMGGRIRRDAAQYMVFVVGRRLMRLHSELEKALLFAGGREITVDMVEQFVSKDTEATAFGLVDAVAEGNVSRALTEVSELWVRGFNAARILAVLTSHFGLMWKVKEIMARGLPVQDAAAELGVHPFAAKKAAKQSSYWSFSALEEAFNCLLQADELIKTGAADPVLTCEAAIAQLAGLKARRSRA